MKKVLLIHPRLAMSGGLESRLLSYIDYFLGKNCEVHVACRKFDKSVIKPGVIVHKFAPFISNKVTKNYIFNKKLEKWNKPTFDFELSLGRTTIQRNILAPATHQGFIRGLNRKKLSKADKLYIEMDQRGYDASSHIFAASQKVKTEILEFYKVPVEKVVVLYPPFNFNKHVKYTAAEKISIRKEYKLDSSKIYHLFVSVSHDLKGLPLLNTVFNRLKDTPHTLLVIGKPFHSSVPNVISMGYFKDVSKAYALGDYLLHPSQYDAYAQVISEALFHQVPVVVSPNTGAKEILNPQMGIIAPNRLADTWVDIISGLQQQAFSIPTNIIEDLGLDLNNHMSAMLKVNGLDLNNQ